MANTEPCDLHAAKTLLNNTEYRNITILNIIIEHFYTMRKTTVLILITFLNIRVLQLFTRVIRLP